MRARRGDSGRASLEFLVVALGMVIPVMFLGMSVASLQGASLAAHSAAQQAARVFVQHQSVGNAWSHAERVALVAVGNHGHTSIHRMERFCEPSSCLLPGSAVTIRVTLAAPLFTSDFLPGVLGAEVVHISEESTSVVSRYGVPR